MRMNRKGWSWFFAALLWSAGLALPVRAQDQTPAEPGLGANVAPVEDRAGAEQPAPQAEGGGRQLRFERRDDTAKPGANAAERLREEPAKKQPDKKEPDKAAATQQEKPAETPTKTVKKVGKKAGPGTAATSSRGNVTPVTVTVGGGTFDPILQRPVEPGEIPDVGEVMTGITGPMKVVEFLDLIATATEWNILVSTKAQAVELQFWLSNKKPKEALEILKFNGVHYEFDPKTNYLYVMLNEERLQQQYGAIESETFIAQQITPAHLQSLLESFSSANGRIVTDPRTGHIYVWDTKDNLDKMRAAVKELDVPMESMALSIKHADLADVQAILSTFKSEGGTVAADPRTGQIVFWDLPAVLKQMKDVAAKIDVPLESRVFRLLHVDASTLADSVGTLLSERGSCQIDERFNTMIVTDLPARQDLVAELVETLDQPLETRTWVIKYADLDFVSEQLEAVLPEKNGLVSVNEDAHQITVSALPERLEDIDVLIQTWDIKRRQVQIEGYLLTATKNVSKKLGVNWSYFSSSDGSPVSFRYGAQSPNHATAGADGAPRFQIGQLPYMDELRTPFLGKPIESIGKTPVIDAFRGDHISALIDYLDDRGDVDVLSHPRVTVQDGEVAAFERTSSVPYVSSVSYGSGAGYGGMNQPRTAGQTGGRNNNTPGGNQYGYSGYYGPQSAIQFVEVGTILDVVPRITEDGNILLDVSAEESTYQMREVIGASETNTVPEKMQNRAETQVLVHDGQTIVIGGLRKKNMTDSVQKIPFLGDVPFIGKAFRNTKKEGGEQDLLIFITPTIVDEYTFPETTQLAKADDRVSERIRKEDRNDWRRLADSLRLTKNEFGVSVGQDGNLHSEGAPISLDELRERVTHLAENKHAKIVVRRHPRAPSDVSKEIERIAQEAGIPVSFDDAFVPFVPANRPAEEEAVPALPEAPAEAATSPAAAP